MPVKPTTGQNFDKNAAKLVNSAAKGLTNPTVPKVLAEGDITPSGNTVTRAMALESLRIAGETITKYSAHANDFLYALVNRIARVIVTSRLYENPWAWFKRGQIELGETVEEIFVNIMSAQEFDPERAERELYKQEKPDVRSAFHTLNYRKFYKVTVSNAQLRPAFTSFDGLGNLIESIIQALVTSANFDELLVMKYLLCLHTLSGSFYPETIPAATPANSNAIATVLKTISDNVTFLDSAFNKAGVFTHTPKDRQILIMSTEFANLIDVESLAFAFNLNKIEQAGRIVRINRFGFSPQELDRLNELFAEEVGFVPITEQQNEEFMKIPAVLVDRDFFMIFDYLTEMRDRQNEQGLYWNYFYHIWKIYSVSPFANAIVFAEGTPAIGSVTVTPATATMAKGTLIQLEANVTTANFAPGGVKWTMTGATDNNTTLDQQGRLFVSKYETATTITVTATSWYDDTKSADAVITVT